MTRREPPPLPPPELQAVSRNEWAAVWRRVRVQPNVDVKSWDGRTVVRITAAVKHVGIWAAEFATYETGADIFPGVQALARVTGHAERTAGETLGVIRDLGFLWRYVEGSKCGRQGVADEHRLTIPGDALDRVPLLDPDLNVPDYHRTSDHLISDHLISDPEHPTSDPEHPTSDHPTLQYHSTTSPHLPVSVINSSLEGSTAGRELVDNQDVGEGVCPVCGRKVSIMRGGTLRAHGGRHSRCRGSLRKPLAAIDGEAADG